MPRWRLPMCWKGSGDAGDVIRIMLWSLTGRQMLPGFLRPRTFRRAGAYTGIRAVLRPNPRKGVDDMLRSLQWAALGTGFTFLMTTLGAAMVFFFAGEPKPRFQRAMLGFAAGVMTAASVWSLLLPAIDQAAEDGRLPGWLPAAAGMLLGVMFLAALDALLPHLRRGRPRRWAHGLLLRVLCPDCPAAAKAGLYAEKAEVMCGKLGPGKPACIKAFRGPFGGGPYLSMACPCFTQMLSTSTPAASGHFVQRCGASKEVLFWKKIKAM